MAYEKAKRLSRIAVQDENLGIAHGITPNALRRAFSNASSDGRHVGAVLVVCTHRFALQISSLTSPEQVLKIGSSLFICHT